jgi:hypothetical protein
MFDLRGVRIPRPLCGRLEISFHSGCERSLSDGRIVILHCALQDVERGLANLAGGERSIFPDVRDVVPHPPLQDGECDHAELSNLLYRLQADIVIIVPRRAIQDMERNWDGFLIVGSHNAGCPDQDARHLAITLLAALKNKLSCLEHPAPIIGIPRSGSYRSVG